MTDASMRCSCEDTSFSQLGCVLYGQLQCMLIRSNNLGARLMVAVPFAVLFKYWRAFDGDMNFSNAVWYCSVIL